MSIIRILLTVAVACGFAASSQAAVITVGNHSLLANQPGQTIEIFVAGGDSVSGVNFYAQVGDGGPELADFGLAPGTDGPAITAVDLKTNTIFASLEENPVTIEAIPQYVNLSLAAEDPGVAVSASGLLATLTIDTTGFYDGTWDLLLGDVLSQLGPYDTDFAPTAATILNGSISVAALLGDANCDGQVDAEDAAALALHWKQTGMGWTEGDFNNDGAVDERDASILASHWMLGVPEGQAPAVPEPSTAVLLLGMLLAWSLRRRLGF